MDSDGRRLGSRWQAARHGEVCRSGLGDRRIARARLRDRGERTQVATETSEAKIVTRSAGEETCRKSERSRQSGLVGVNRRAPRVDRV
jgi:hypothetical protein